MRQLGGEDEETRRDETEEEMRRKRKREEKRDREERKEKGQLIRSMSLKGMKPKLSGST